MYSRPCPLGIQVLLQIHFFARRDNGVCPCPTLDPASVSILFLLPALLHVTFLSVCWLMSRHIILFSLFDGEPNSFRQRCWHRAWGGGGGWKPVRRKPFSTGLLLFTWNNKWFHTYSTYNAANFPQKSARAKHHTAVRGPKKTWTAQSISKQSACSVWTSMKSARIARLSFSTQSASNYVPQTTRTRESIQRLDLTQQVYYLYSRRASNISPTTQQQG